MANVTWLGVNYPDLPALTLPKTGGGLARFDDVSDTTLLPADAPAGKYFHQADGSFVEGTGGGGAANFVVGSFTSTNADKGTVKTIALPYSGSGWPIAVSIFPAGGYSSSGSPVGATGRYKTMINFFAVKDDISAEPDYETWDDVSNFFYAIAGFKYDSSASQGQGDPERTSTSGYPGMFICDSTEDPRPSWSMNVVKFPDATHMKVYIGGDVVDENAYGFLAGAEYTYQIVYSE